MSSNDDKLRQVIATSLGVDVSEIKDDASIETFEKWDSLRHLYVVLAIEESFSVKLTDEEAVEVSGLSLLRECLKGHGIDFSSQEKA